MKNATTEDEDSEEKERIHGIHESNLVQEVCVRPERAFYEFSLNIWLVCTLTGFMAKRSCLTNLLNYHFKKQ